MSLKDKYFPVDPVWKWLASELGDDDPYYKYKVEYRPDREGFECLKKGSSLHPCQECKLKYAYYKKKGLLKVKDVDSGAEQDLNWLDCTNCSLGYDIQAAEEAKKLEFPSKEQELEWKIEHDPVEWLKLNLGITLRKYQERVLNCSAKRQIWRFGRRSGKTYALAARVVYSTFVRARWYFEEHPDKMVYRILLVTATKSQVLQVLNEIKNLLFLYPLTKKWNKRIVFKEQPPYGGKIYIGLGDRYVEIKGFCSGSGDGLSIRSSGAEEVYMDEADFIPVDIYEKVISPIITESEDVTTVMCSSVSGRREKFWFFSTTPSSGWVDHWVRSVENPSYTYENDIYNRNNAVTRMSYALEWDCVFVDSIQNVFDFADINKSLVSYKLPVPPSEVKPGELVVVGVDWNGKDIGNHVVVVGYHAPNDDHSRGVFRLLDKRIIKGGSAGDDVFFHKKSCRIITEMALTYKASYIYCDAGFGEQSIENIQLYIKANKLHFDYRNVKGIAMGSMLEVRNPVTGEMTRKYAKKFLIDNLILQLEHKKIMLPRSEDYRRLDEVGLVTQMRNFRIKSVSPSGSVVYEQGYDHTLTAFFLALGGIVLEFSSYGKSGISMTNAKPVIIDRSDNKYSDLFDLSSRLGSLDPALPKVEPGEEGIKLWDDSEKDDDIKFTRPFKIKLRRFRSNRARRFKFRGLDDGFGI